MTGGGRLFQRVNIAKNARVEKVNAVVFLAGEGGHLEQARRIQHRLAPDVVENVVSVLITDSTPERVSAFHSVHTVCNPSPKDRSPRLQDVFRFGLDLFRTLFALGKQYRVAAVVVTGPGFTAVPALYWRLLGARLLVFESWSRFEKRAKCSRLLYRFSHRFFIQHKELQPLYPKATWVGLL